MLKPLAMAISYIENQFFLGSFASIFRFESKTVLNSLNGNMIFAYFLFSLALLQKTKQVLLYFEHLFGFL